MYTCETNCYSHNIQCNQIKCLLSPSTPSCKYCQNDNVQLIDGLNGLSTEYSEWLKTIITNAIKDRQTAIKKSIELIENSYLKYLEKIFITEIKTNRIDITLATGIINQFHLSIVDDGGNDTENRSIIIASEAVTEKTKDTNLDNKINTIIVGEKIVENSEKQNLPIHFYYPNIDQSVSQKIPLTEPPKCGLNQQEHLYNPQKYFTTLNSAAINIPKYMNMNPAYTLYNPSEMAINHGSNLQLKSENKLKWIMENSNDRLNENDAEHLLNLKNNFRINSYVSPAQVHGSSYYYQQASQPVITTNTFHTSNGLRLNKNLELNAGINAKLLGQSNMFNNFPNKMAELVKSSPALTINKYVESSPLKMVKSWGSHFGI